MQTTVNKTPIPLKTDIAVLSLIASILLFAHLVVGDRYGFHRDELQFLDDARHLQAGFVAYPPLTSLSGRAAIAIFGISVHAFRLPAVLANMLSLVLVGLTAREMGGRRPAQILALLFALPIALAFSTVLQYNSFDYLAWALVALFTSRLLRTQDPRWWVAIGASFGVGILSKYSVAFLAVSVLAGVTLLPRQRHHLRDKWFYCGALLMFVVASPNLFWLFTHDFVTLRMEHHIHVRDVALGRASGYFTDQIKYAALSMPFVVLGLVSLVRSARFRLLSLFYVGPFVLFALAQGRGYYLLPAYIPAFAGAGVTLEAWLASKTMAFRLRMRLLAFGAALVNVIIIGSLFLPVEIFWT